MLYIIVCEVDVIANSLVLYLPFCSTLNTNFFSSSLSSLQDLASNPSQIDMIIMDFSKAFDKVPHRRRNHKLDWYGIRGNTREWILAFLSGRSQRVVLEGASSDSEPVVSGVPQGTVLGPVLFLLYLNDLPDVAVHSTARLFADDCVVYRPIRNNDATILLQNDLKGHCIEFGVV